MAIPIKKEKYTYKDYLSWKGDGKWEIIDGEVYAMSPSPSRIHQEISGNLFFYIKTYLLDKTCKVYAAPFDVRLCDEEEDEKIKNVVQPDITVVCDEGKLDYRGVKGAPDFIIEIVSPSSTFLDYVKKLNLYGEYGVREYWIVDPKDENVLVYKVSEDGKYGKPQIYNNTDEIKVSIFQDLVIDLKKIF